MSAAMAASVVGISVGFIQYETENSEVQDFIPMSVLLYTHQSATANLPGIEEDSRLCKAIVNQGKDSVCKTSLSQAA